MNLDRETFLTVVRSAPLVAIDLIAKNGAGQALLGKRVNRPAQGWRFVPGGRIYYRWWDVDKLLISPEVHENTRGYFLS